MVKVIQLTKGRIQAQLSLTLESIYFPYLLISEWTQHLGWGGVTQNDLWNWEWLIPGSYLLIFKYFSFKFSFQLKLLSPPLCEREDLRVVLARDTKRKSLGPRRNQGKNLQWCPDAGSDWFLRPDGEHLPAVHLVVPHWHLKVARVGERIPQKLANAISQRLFPPLWNPVVKYLPAQHCLWPKNSSYLLPTYLKYNAETGME